MSHHCTKSSNDKLLFFVNGKRVSEDHYRSHYDVNDRDCLTKEQRKNMLKQSISNYQNLQRDHSRLLSSCEEKLGRCNKRVTELEASLLKSAETLTKRCEKDKQALEKTIQALRASQNSNDDRKYDNELEKLRVKLLDTQSEFEKEKRSFSSKLDAFNAERQTFDQSIRDVQIRSAELDKKCEGEKNAIIQERDEILQQLKQMSEDRDKKDASQRDALESERNDLRQQLSNLTREQENLASKNIKTVETLSKARDALLEEKTISETAIAQYKKAIEVYKQNIDDLSRQVADCKSGCVSQIEALNADFAQKERGFIETISTLKERVTALEQELSKERSETNETFRKYKEDQETLFRKMQADFDQKLDDCNRTCEESKQTLREGFRKDLSERDTEFTETREALKSQNQKLLQEVDAVNAQIEKTTSDFELQKSEFTQKLAAEKSRYDKNLSELKDMRDNLEISKSTHSNEKARLEETHRDAVSQIRAEFERAESERARLNAKLTETEQKLENISLTNQQIQKLLDDEKVKTSDLVARIDVLLNSQEYKEGAAMKKDRDDKERLELERLEQLNREKLEKLEKERVDRLAQREKERVEKLEKDRQAQEEKLEKDRQAQDEKEEKERKRLETQQKRQIDNDKKLATLKSHLTPAIELTKKQRELSTLESAEKKLEGKITDLESSIQSKKSMHTKCFDILTSSQPLPQKVSKLKTLGFTLDPTTQISNEKISIAIDRFVASKNKQAENAVDEHNKKIKELETTRKEIEKARVFLDNAKLAQDAYDVQEDHNSKQDYSFGFRSKRSTKTKNRTKRSPSPTNKLSKNRSPKKTKPSKKRSPSPKKKNRRSIRR